MNTYERHAYNHGLAGEYDDRISYLRFLEAEFDCQIPFEMIVAAAELLGPTEDFDGLISTLEDAAMGVYA